MPIVDHIVDHFAVDHAWLTNQQVNYSVVRLTKDCKWSTVQILYTDAVVVD
jgi:hypothetical protein